MSTSRKTKRPSAIEETSEAAQIDHVHDTLRESKAFAIVDMLEDDLELFSAYLVGLGWTYRSLEEILDDEHEEEIEGYKEAFYDLYDKHKDNWEAYYEEGLAVRETLED